MNRTAVVGTIAVFLIAIIALVLSVGADTPPPTATSTPRAAPPSQQVPQARERGAPYVVTGSDVGIASSAATVSGTVTPSGSPTRYWYEYGATPELGRATSRQVIGSGFVPLPAPAYITGLTKATTYYYRLVAENALGREAGTLFTFVTASETPSPAGSVPSATTKAATAVTDTSASVHASVSPRGVGIHYWFEYGTTTDMGETTSLVAAGNGTALVAASASLSNLRPETTYHFRVNAHNQFGTVNGTSLTFTTKASLVAVKPVAMTRAATALATTTATLRALVNPGGVSTRYWFEYSSDPALGAVLIRTTPRISLLADTDESSVEVDVFGLTPSTTYYYRIVAENTAGVVRGERMSFRTK